ncbi:MAG: hypothetical protein WC565_03505 [Parcubacteria group bacterium]
MIDELRIEPWLSEIVDEMSRRPSPLDRWIAAGLIGRLWSPCRDQLELAKSLAISCQSPGLVARQAWQEADRGKEVFFALLRVDDLFEGLERAEQGIAVSGPSYVTSWLKDRDDLECVAYLERGIDSAIVPALEALDIIAQRHTMFRRTRLSGPRFWAVHLRDIDAWWGGLVDMSS